MSQLDKKFKLSACGGTFDLFHFGHEDFLLSISKVSEKIIIGITSDEFSAEKLTYEKFDVRKKSVEKFVHENKINAEIIKIDDIYGPTLSNKYSFDSLFVTADSIKGAEKINERRKELELNPLEITIIPLYKTPDGKTLSSTRIKNGEVNRKGELYIDEKVLNSDFILPENLRYVLSQPFGKLINKIEDTADKKIITVGDETTKSFLSKNINPVLSIVDLKNNREKKYESVSDLGLTLQKIINVDNPSGHITGELFRAVIYGLKNKNSAVLVNGEEDLAVIPAVLASPLGYRIYYGQPNQGVVEIIVTESIKNEIRTLISKFSQKVI